MTNAPRQTPASKQRILRHPWIPAAVSIPACAVLVWQLAPTVQSETATHSTAYLIAIGLLVAQYVGSIALHLVFSRLEIRIFSPLFHTSELGVTRLVAIERTLLASPITSDLRIVYAGSSQATTARKNDVFIVDEDPHDDDTAAGVVIGIKAALQRRVGFSPVILLIAFLGWLSLSGALYFVAGLAQLTFFFGSLYVALWGMSWITGNLLPTRALKRTAVETGLLTPSEIADLGPFMRAPLYALAYLAIITGVLVFQWIVVTS